MTTVQRTTDPPTDTYRRERRLERQARLEEAAEQARREHELLLLTAGLLHVR